MENKEAKTRKQKSVESASFTLPSKPQTLNKQDANEKNAVKTLEPVKAIKKTDNLANNKQKYKKLERKQFKNKKLKRAVLIGLLFVALALGVYFAITLIKDKIEDNGQLTVLETGQIDLVKIDDEYFLSVPFQSNADVYFFEIKKNEDEQIFEIESLSNLVSATGVFHIPGVYEVRFAIQKQNNPSTKSDFTAWVSLTSTQKLETPIFEYDTSLKEFSWQEVQNANAYKLFYFQEEELKTKIISDFTASAGMIKKSFEDLNLNLGVYEFTLIAINTEVEYFTASDYNQKIRVENFVKLDKVESGNYNTVSKLLTITIKEYKEDLKLKISYGENQSLTVSLQENSLEHSFLLSQYNDLNEHLPILSILKVSLVSESEFFVESDILEVDLSN